MSKHYTLTMEITGGTVGSAHYMLGTARSVGAETDVQSLRAENDEDALRIARLMASDTSEFVGVASCRLTQGDRLVREW